MKIPVLLNWIGFIIAGIVAIAVLSYKGFVKARVKKSMDGYKKDRDSLNKDEKGEEEFREKVEEEIRKKNEENEEEFREKVEALDTSIKRLDSSIVDINKEIAKTKSKRRKLINGKKAFNEGVIAYEKEKTEYENYLKTNGESLKESKKEFINRIDAFIAESGVESGI